MGINYAGRYFSLTNPVVMGIVNATPDSFFEGSRYSGTANLLPMVEKMLTDGASIIDVGAYSTRPMAADISIEEEKRRLDEVLGAIVKEFPECMLSVDTFRSDVARHVVTNYGVGIINDIGGTTLDNAMIETVAELGVVYVLMHIKGDPHTMQSLCRYDDIVTEVISFLQEKIHCLRQAGVKDIIVDPGFGFAKNIEQNYQLLNNLEALSCLDAPVLAGVSRKSMVYKLLGNEPSDALNGTTALHMIALTKGARILRAHDVKEATETIKIFNALHGKYTT